MRSLGRLPKKLATGPRLLARTKSSRSESGTKQGGPPHERAALSCREYFFVTYSGKAYSVEPCAKVQSLQTNTGFEYTEVPNSPSDRAVVHPVPSPNSLRDDSVLASRRGPVPVSSGVARDSH